MHVGDWQAAMRYQEIITILVFVVLGFNAAEHIWSCLDLILLCLGLVQICSLHVYCVLVGFICILSGESIFFVERYGCNYFTNCDVL